MYGSIDSGTAYFACETYFPYLKIVMVDKYFNRKDHYDAGSVFNQHLRDTGIVNRNLEYYNVLFSIIEACNLKKCTCQMAQLIKDIPLEQLFIECTCNLDIFPLYEITIDGDKETYLLHPADRPAMERYLRGDDPMAELVHELRWNPEINIGREKRRAMEHFEENKG